MSVIGGKDAYVAGLTGVQSWTATKTVAMSPFSHSGVPGGTQVLYGSTDYTWGIEGVGFYPGIWPDGVAASAQFVLKDDVPKLSFTGSILTESMTITIDKENPQNPIKWQLTGGFTGNRTTSATGTSDSAANYGAQSGRTLDVTVNDHSLANGTFSTCIRSCVINLKRPLTTYRCGGVTYRLAGNLEASITLNLFDDDPSLLPTAVTTGTEVHVLVDSDGYILSDIFWGSVTGPGANRTNNAPTECSITGMWSGADGGSIVGPDALTIYG